MTKGTPASSQIITLERILSERDMEIERLQESNDILRSATITQAKGAADQMRQIARLNKDLGDAEVDIDILTVHNIELQQRVEELSK